MSNGRVRRKERKFTQVSNILITDSVSLKAKGLYTLINYFIEIPNFDVYKSHIAKQCIEGEKAFESTWKELKDKGYLKMYKMKDNKTKQFYYEYELLDEPEIEGENKKPDPQKVGGGKGSPGKGRPAKKGVYNKTSFNKTSFNKTKENNRYAGKRKLEEWERGPEYYEQFEN